MSHAIGAAMLCGQEPKAVGGSEQPQAGVPKAGSHARVCSGHTRRPGAPHDSRAGRACVQVASPWSSSKLVQKQSR